MTARAGTAVGPVAAAVLAGALAGCGGGGSQPGADAATTDAAGASDAAPPVTDPLVYVDPRIGTGGFGFAHGSSFVGAAAPRGLAKVGPDTKGPYGTISFLHYSGYWAGDDRIQGFSHLHLHGTGATDYGVLGIMPTDGFDADRTTRQGYESSFDKATESATAGRYEVTLDRGDIRAEIVATDHGAHHRFTYPEAAPSATVIIDLDHHLGDGTVADATIELDAAAGRLRGRLRSVGGMSGGFGGYDVWFEARTRRPWTSSWVWADGAAPAEGDLAAGAGVGAALVFASPADPVELQVGISLVSAEGAAANLDAELPAWDLEATAAATAERWRERVGVVEIEGGSAAERRIFYSALYRMFLMPTVTSDVDGRYRFGPGEPRTAGGFAFVSDMSLWDTYRTVHPLYALLAPDAARDAARSLTEMAAAIGYYPRWPIATGEAGTMLGASAEIVIADAYLRGVRDFDAAGAYATLRAAALDDQAPPGGRGGRGDVEVYSELGYVPASVDRSVSLTTEYAADDWALGNLAGALGDDADAALLDARSRGYRALYDPATGFLRARSAAGVFVGDPDPLAFAGDFAEANAWQSLWMAQHDVDGLAALLGGREAMADKLDTFFSEAAADLAANPLADLPASSVPRPYYWQGNEPDIHAAYLFAQIGRPDLTQRWVRWIMDSLYGDGPDGLPGNDDGGTLSAWWVASALGLYPVPGSDLWVLGAPRFPLARVEARGGVLQIEAPGVSADAIYVQSVTLDGHDLGSPLVHDADLAGGGVLHFEMGTAPGSWGR